MQKTPTSANTVGPVYGYHISISRCPAACVRNMPEDTARTRTTYLSDGGSDDLFTLDAEGRTLRASTPFPHRRTALRLW